MAFAMRRQFLKRTFGSMRSTQPLKTGNKVGTPIGSADVAAARAAEADLQNMFEVYKRGVQENVVVPFKHFCTANVAVPVPLVILGGFSMVALMQAWYGTQDNPYQPVFEEKYTTKKDPEALSDFYQAEELLRIIAINPIFFNLFMNKVDFDTAEMTEETAILPTSEAEGTAGVEAEVHLNVKGLGMEVSFEIIKQEEEIDGEEVLTHFCRHERFIDWVPFLYEMGIKIMLWDQTWKFMFDRQENGEYVVTHKCTKFAGPFPIRVIVWFHQKYVVWACEKFINETDFGHEDADLDEQQAILGNMPVHFAKEYTGIETQQQKKDRIAMIEAYSEVPNQELWRVDAVTRRPSFRKYIKAPPVEKEEEDEE